MTYQMMRKSKNLPVSGAEKVQPTTQAAHMATADVSQPSNGQLDELMQARMQRFMQHQIPQAEKEADQIAAGVRNARTPQQVKAQLGETMGADFSDVRFHTGADAVSKAESMGARAFATGRDVYFGEGGFDPSVAAHELVHTTQQGVVDSGMATTSAPTGGVQMMPKWADIKRGIGNVGHVIAGGARMAGHGIAKAASAVGHGVASAAKAVGHGVASAASGAWNGITGLFKSKPAAAVASPTLQYHPGTRSAEEDQQYGDLGTQLAQEYRNATVTGDNKQSQYINILANHNRNNANFSGFKQSTTRLRQGAAVKGMLGNIGTGLGKQFKGKAGKERLAGYSRMNKGEMLQDQNGAKDVSTFSGNMMDQMSLLLDDPEMQRYILGNAQALRGATAGKGGDQDFFGDDHMLANTLLNNMNLYMMNPDIGGTARAGIAKKAGFSDDQQGMVTKFSQAGTTMFNSINSLHAGAGTGDLTEDQLSQMGATLRAGRGTLIGDDAAIQNLSTKQGNQGRAADSYSRDEIEAMKNELYNGRSSEAYDDATMKKYHALYLKMRALIGPQQQQ